jgi:hypothetical protein
MIEAVIEKAIEKAVESSATLIEKFWDKIESETDVPMTKEDMARKETAKFWDNLVNDNDSTKLEQNITSKETDNISKTDSNEVSDYSNNSSDVSDKARNCPIEGNNGHWEGERGNSKWIPDRDYVPQKSNPEGKTWGEIMDNHGIDGIDYKDGEPDFGEVSKGNVEIEGFSENRSDNFDKADMELAKAKGCSPEDVASWRKENSYTWHECRDMKSMQKVPSDTHGNMSHRGGVSEAKKSEVIND